MAPASNSAKALQQNRPRPAVPRTVVPAIPLPYVQKRQQQEAARARAREEAAAPTVVETPAPSSPASTTAHTSPAIVNGSSKEQIAERPEESTEVASPTTPATPATPALEQSSQTSEVGETEVSVQDTTTEEPQETPRSVPSETQSSASRSTYQMPPPFVPAHHGQFNGMAPDQSKYPPPPVFNGQPPMHHTHPSAGSVMFGGYPDSNNSSPAPPPSAGNAPPYPYQQAPQHGAVRQAPHQSNGTNPQNMPNGFSPMGPPPPPGYYPRPDGFINQGGNDNFARRQMPPFGPPDAYSGAPSYDPSTPQSFHGSQSSAPNEQENGPAFYSQYPTAVVNGSNGHIDEVRLYHQPKNRTASQQVVTDSNNFPGPVRHPAHQLDHFDGLVGYVQAQFADPTFADYTLELRYSDDRAPPVRIPGHNLMFARSPMLKNLMTAQARDSNSDGLTVRTLLIESDDRHLRSDGFWMAVQRLYAGPLLDLGAAAMAANAQFTGPMPGTPADRFDLALGYAAAGHILQIPPVVQRGIENASHFVNWTTLEKALDFSLDGGLDSQWTLATHPETTRSPSTYGPDVNILISSALNWVITNFPAGFKLDTSAGEPTRNRRLPAVQDLRPSAPNPRLSMIKFGDHPSEESIRSTSANSVTVTLSKVLLNLPFHLLKYVLESSRLGNVQGWATTVLRQDVMHTVIQEREKRRLKVHGATYVSNAERNANAKEWDAVGWQESVEALDGNEATPTLSRTWVGFTDPDS
ncbi:hypothetical protein N431DRAFT_542445 [Stipitochalara longipes BDJ]|nr:hypothetical protein N431DRAFT_542445 [Stipitochalara longipes BDJ]